MHALAAAVVVIAAVILVLRWWLISHPKTPCGWCGGTGDNRLSVKWRKGDCKHCGGSGKRRSRLYGGDD